MRRLRFLTRWLITWAAGLASWSIASAIDAATPWPTKDWQVSTPEAHGMDSTALARLYEYLATPGFNTDSVLLIRHGRIVSETFVPPYRSGLRHDLRSVTKSVVATLVGAAIQEGTISSAERKVLSFFPEHPVSSPMQSNISVKHLLDMASGIRWQEWPYNQNSDAVKMWGSKDWVKFVLEREVTTQPGENFHYIAAAPHLLSAIITRSTGYNAADFARRSLFARLGISDFTWPADPQGHSVGESALHMKPRDMAKIGYLYLREGRWGDVQLIPENWVERMFSGGLPNGLNPSSTPPTYSQLWWTDAAVPYAAAQGRHGQYIILLPKQDVILVITSKAADTSPRSQPTELVNRYLLPAIRSEGAIPLSTDAHEKLQAAIARLADSGRAESRQPTDAVRQLSKRRFVLEPNRWGYKEIELNLAGAQPGYLLLQADKGSPAGVARGGGPIGLDGRYVTTGFGTAGLSARRGRWIDETTFRIETQELESAIVGEWTMSFGSGQLELSYADGDGNAFRVKGMPKECRDCGSPAPAGAWPLPRPRPLGRPGSPP